MTGEIAPLGVQICHALAARGVRTVFGIPGVHNQELYRGFSGTSCSHVLARHEQGAGFMADGYARALRVPGVAFVISGPGLTNALTPVGQAFSDSVPMLVIATCLEEEAAFSRGARLHELKDQMHAGDSVADWSCLATNAEAAYLLMDRAFSEFSSRRHRPKIINIPISLLSQPAPPAPRPPNYPGRPPPDQDLVSEVADLVMGADRPVIILGGGAVEAVDAARAVVERSHAACFMTYAGRGIISPGYGLNFGSFLARPESADVLARADLVIAVGTTLSETDIWRDELGHDCRMVRVDIDPAAFADLGKDDIRVIGGAGEFLGALRPQIRPFARPGGWSEAEIERSKAEMTRSCAIARPGLAEIARATFSRIPSDTMVYSDMTQLAYVAKEVVDLEVPGRWHHPYGFGTLGYALPAAIGGKVALPGSPVLAVAGDYGFQYTMQELGTLVDTKLPVAVLVWDNGGLGEIELSMTQAGIEPTATEAFLPDLELLARSYGVRFERPGTLSDLAAVVENSLNSRETTLIHTEARELCQPA